MWDGTPSANRILLDVNYVKEPKYDDWRALAVYGPAGVTLFSNQGNILEIAPSVKHSLEAIDLPEGTCLDGCQIGKRGGLPDYIVFDIPMLGGVALRETLDQRRDRLERLPLRLVERLPSSLTAFRDAIAMSTLDDGIIEGVVCKLRSSLPVFNSKPKQTSASWVKIKVPPHYERGKLRLGPFTDEELAKLPKSRKAGGKVDHARSGAR